MRNTIVESAVCCVLLYSVTSLYGQLPWDEIHPLTTSRAEVTKFLGEPTSIPCDQCIYDIRQARTIVNYSKGHCDDGWKVDRDTVLSSIVYPKTTLDPSIVNGAYVELSSQGRRRFVFPQLGRIYDTDLLRLTITSINIVPSTRSEGRCPLFPKYDVVASLYHPVASYFEFDLKSIRSFLETIIYDSDDLTSRYKTYLVFYRGVVSIP